MVRKRDTVAKQQSKAPIDITPIVQQAELLDLRLLNCMCTLGSVENQPSELKQSIGVHVVENKDDPKVLPIRTSFTLVGADHEGQEGLRIEATYGLMYRIESLADYTPNHMLGFAQLIGLNNAWPYWREFVQSATARMGFPPLTLPLLRPAQLQLAHGPTEEPKKSAAKKRGGQPKKEPPRVGE